MKIATNNVHSNATLVGSNHVISTSSCITRLFGAKKENVILENGVWMQGRIYVEYDGQVIMQTARSMRSSILLL